MSSIWHLAPCTWPLVSQPRGVAAPLMSALMYRSHYCSPAFLLPTTVAPYYFYLPTLCSTKFYSRLHGCMALYGTCSTLPYFRRPIAIVPGLHSHQTRPDYCHQVRLTYGHQAMPAYGH